jgi:phage FluMu protein Com
MPIEFHCTQCGKLLRTGDDTAGKKAKCPQCGAVLPIPEPAAAQSQNPYQSPGEMETPPELAAEILRGFHPTRIEVGDVMSRTWTIYKANLWPCVLVVFLYLVINFGMPQLVSFGLRSADAMNGLALGVINILGGLLSIWLSLGLWIYMLKTARGEKADVADLFSGGRLIVPAIGISLIVLAAVIVGSILLIVPGIIISLMWSQATLVLIDRRTGVLDSLRYSARATSGNKLTLFAIGLAASVIGLVSTVCTIGVGLFFVYPYMALLLAVSYLAMTGQTTADQFQPQASA